MVLIQLEREREKEEARKLKEATRLKAAIERATARRLARECVELIDDERLELLEAAASSQSLPKMLSPVGMGFFYYFSG